MNLLTRYFQNSSGHIKHLFHDEIARTLTIAFYDGPPEFKHVALELTFKNVHTYEQVGHDNHDEGDIELAIGFDLMDGEYILYTDNREIVFRADDEIQIVRHALQAPGNFRQQSQLPPHGSTPA